MKYNTHALNEKAKGLAADYLHTEGQLLLVLMEMRRRRLFAELNYSGIFDYCERALKLSSAQAYYFKTVAEKSEEVPEIRQAVGQPTFLTCTPFLRARAIITSRFGAQIGVRFERSERTKSEAYPSICRGFCERAAFKGGPKMRCPKREVIIARALS